MVQGSRYKLTYDGMYHFDIPKTRQYDTGKIEVIARSSAGEALATTELKVIPRHDDYRGVLKNAPRREYFTLLRHITLTLHFHNGHCIYLHNPLDGFTTSTLFAALTHVTSTHTPTRFCTNIPCFPSPSLYPKDEVQLSPASTGFTIGCRERYVDHHEVCVSLA